MGGTTYGSAPAHQRCAVPSASIASTLLTQPGVSFCRILTSVACTGLANVASSHAAPSFIFSGDHASGLLPATLILGAPVASAAEYFFRSYCELAVALAAHWPAGSATI